jgi:hypothetical protein
MDYRCFLDNKTQLYGEFGFDPVWMPEAAKDFQSHLIDWSCRKGRSAVFADCGLGKTLIQLAWAENVARVADGRVLILTPLSVANQTVREGEKFGVDCLRVIDGVIPAGAPRIIVTNYERLHYFNADDFVGCVCDESSILKNVAGKTRFAIIAFMRKMKYRLLCTATASPNDFIELGNSSEALGNLDYFEMLTKYFKSTENDNSISQWGNKAQSSSGKWRFRGHAERDFWRWVCSWARAVRKPSDLGFSDDGYELPELILEERVVVAENHNPEFLFALTAHTMEEQRDEARRTIRQRCEEAADFLSTATTPAVAWCHLNEEADTLRKMISGAVEIRGSDKDERKEEVLDAFQRGEISHLITKSRITGFGLNWQHCAFHSYFPSHSFEQFYQAIRRSWRYGQVNDVRACIISSEANSGIVTNMKRKAANADALFANLVALMNNELAHLRTDDFTQQEEIPTWL